MSCAKTPSVRAVIFDFDGTLTKPGSLEFAKIKAELGCPLNRPVLEFIATLETGPRRRAQQLLDEFEYRAAEVSEPNRGAERLLDFLGAHRIPCAIVSRNSLRSVLRALENFDSVSTDHFEALITRDDRIPPKPDPASIHKVALRLGLPVEQVLTVGDFIYDVEAGKRSGALTAYLSNDSALPSFKEPPDYVVSDLEELETLIDRLRPLPVGKLPNRFLEESLSEVTDPDGQLLIKPGIGEDVAAVNLTSKDEGLVLKSDPITFATDRLGYYAIVVSANDLATAGAVPRWLLTTILLPIGTNAAQAQKIIAEVNEFCGRYHLQLCGGHTEITHAVSQSVVVAHLTGTATRSDLLEKQHISTGDRVLLTKGVAIEGAATIAHEFPQELLKLGLSENDISSAQRLLYDPGISVLGEAQLAKGLDGVTAMHDVTEGGLATALDELSAASNCRISIDTQKIHILPEAKKICQLLGLDPLGLIASGSLLITCKKSACGNVLMKLRSAGITTEVLGKAKGPGRGIELTQDNATWPKFETDEISRAFEILTKVRSASR